MPGEVEEIKRRLDIAEVIGAYVQLVRAGSASLKARCPFHQEKTPSFHVSRDRQMWHCFGCSEGGDIFSFIMKIEGMEFPEALRLLADRAGVQLAEYKPEQRSERRQLIDIVEFATKVFEKLLAESPRAEAARAYVVERGISPDMQTAFRLGYAPDAWDGLIAFAAQKGIGVAELVKAGLAIPRDTAPRGTARAAYDRFRNRLMFPIRDVHGTVVGFTARTLTNAPDEPKYINSPETALYKKSDVLYGLDRARQAIRHEDRVVVVEGNMDVIACHQAGYENTIAVSGTAFTNEQINLIRRFTENMVVSFDADAAGRTAALRGIDLALSAGMQVFVVALPDGAGKDPDEVIKKDQAVWKRAVANAQPVMEWLFSDAFGKADMSKAEEKTRIGQFLLPRLARVQDPIAQTHWMQVLARRLSVPEETLRRTIARLDTKKLPAKQSPTDGNKAGEVRPPARTHRVAEEFLAILARTPALMAESLKQLTPDMLPTDELADLYRQMILRYTQGEKPVPDPTDPVLPGTLGHTLARVLVLGESVFSDAPIRPDDELRRLSILLRQTHKRSEQERLAGLIASAEAAGDEQAIRTLTTQFQALIAGGEHLHG